MWVSPVKMSDPHFIIMENKTGMDAIEISNLELYKDQAEMYRKGVKSIFFTCLKDLPKEMIIEMLKEKKVIKHEYDDKTGKLKLVERN